MRHFAVVALLALVACDGATDPIGSEGSPIPPPVLTGDIWGSSSVHLMHNVKLGLKEASNGAITGSWTARRTGYGCGAEGCLLFGTVSGTRTGDNIKLTTRPTHQCEVGEYDMELTRTNSTTATGTAWLLRCGTTERFLYTASAVTLNK